MFFPAFCNIEVRDLKFCQIIHHVINQESHDFSGNYRLISLLNLQNQISLAALGKFLIW